MFAKRTLQAGFAGLTFVMACATAADAQQVPRVGFVSFQGPALAGDIKYFRDGMTALGHTEGKTYTLESHFTAADRAKTQAIIEALVEKPVDVLVVQVTPVAHIAKQATKTLPVVMFVSDALASGLVPSLSRPGGNLTGITMAGPDAAGKRLEILRELRPSIRTVAFVGASTSPNGKVFARETKEAANRTGMKVVERFVGNPSEFNEILFEGLKREGAEAVVIQPIFTGHGNRIAPLAMKFQLPVISDYSQFAQAGALFSFGVDFDERVRRLAYFVDRILKGAKPADLPVEQPTSFKLVINIKTAKALGWNIPETFLTRADEVIE